MSSCVHRALAQSGGCCAFKILNKSNGTYRDLTDKERIVFKNISQELKEVLDPSDERNRSILPQDLKTAARFVDVVAE